MLTRPRRQVLATLALGLFTVVPTLIVVATTVRVNRPGHLREVEAEIGRRLGVIVKVSSAQHPRPGVDVLRGVSLRLDDAARSEIARGDLLRITRDGSDMALQVEGLTVRGDGPASTLGQVVALMGRAGSSDTRRISLAAESVAILLGEDHFAFRDLAAIFEEQDGQSSLNASYVVADDRSDAPKSRCEMTLRRSSTDSGMATAVCFRTMDGSVPARVLAPFFDPSAWLGPVARVEGSLTANRFGSGDWEVGFQGDLTGVDLAAVVGRRFSGHRLSGTARLHFEAARWSPRAGDQGSGWTEARGSLSAGQGAISVGLLRSLAAEMKFRLTGRPDPTRADIEFQNLGLRFALKPSGELDLGGSLGGEYAADAVLVQGHRSIPLAKAPEGAANVRGLWKALIPAPAEAMAPAVPASHVLRSLPLPGADPGPLRAN